MISFSKDTIWNILGSVAYGAVGMILFIAITRICGSDISGEFSVAFVTAQMMMYIGNYGVRAYQSSDIQEKYSFYEYLLHRVFTIFLMIIATVVYIYLKNYDAEMARLFFLVCIYKICDVIADVFEGCLQQKKMFYKSGVSLFFRTTLSAMLLIIFLKTTNNIIFTMELTIVFSVLLVLAFCIFPLIKSHLILKKDVNIYNIGKLFVDCFPIFLGMFMLTYIINSPKYAMEKFLDYENQTYYSALYFPAQMIYLCSQFIFKPMLVPIAELWEKGKKVVFSVINKLLKYTIFITILLMILCYFLGVPVLGFLYGLDFKNYQKLLMFMMLGGGCIAIINMLCNMYVVIRKQKVLTITYGIIWVLSFFLPNILVEKYALNGAVYSYFLLLLLLSLFLLLYYSFLVIRFRKKHKENLKS